MSENDFFEKYNRSLVKVGARSLYHRAVKIYTEAVTNDTPLKPDSPLARIFNEPNEDLVLRADPDETPIYGRQTDSPMFTDYLDSFIYNINVDYSATVAGGQPSHEFLKEQYEKYEIPEPPDGFFDINHGVVNWWEKTTQYKNGFFSKVFALKVDLKKKELILNSNFKIDKLDLPMNYDTLITSPDKKYNDLRTKLVSSTISSFIEQNLFEQNLYTGFSKLTPGQKVALIETQGIKNNYFLFLQPGFKLKPNPDKKTATLFVKVFFDVYGASVALSLTDITGFTEPPKVPSGIRKSFLVKNFQKSLDSIKKYIKQVKKAKKNKGILPLDVPELLLKNSKTLKDIFKKIVKDNGLGPDSTVTFVFDGAFAGEGDEPSIELRFLALVDGNNITLKSEELKILLNTDTQLNNAICVLNYINCFIGGNAEEEEEEDESFPFAFAPPPATQEEINAAHKKQKSKSKFIGDPTLKGSLKFLAHAGGKTIAAMYDQFYNRVDIAGVTSFAKQDLASIVPEDQVKKIKFQAYIESLDINEIFDCVLTSLFDTGFHAPLEAAIYATFSYFYNAAKIDDPETFNFIDETKPLPVALSEPKDFAYITMIPEEQKAKIFSTIVNNNPQYRNNPELKNAGLIEISQRPDFAPEDFITLAIRRSVMEFVNNELPLAGPPKEEEEPKEEKPKSPEEVELDKAASAMQTAKSKQEALFKEVQKLVGQPDSPEKKALNLEYEKAYDEWDKAMKEYNKASDKFYKTQPKFDPESKKTELDFDRLFTLVSKNNKKLRDSFKPGKAYSNDDLKVYRSQQKSLKKVHKTPSFGWFNVTTPILTHNAFLSELVNQAKEQAMLAILKNMADAAKSGTDKQMNGNPDALDKLDSSAAALIGSNDPLQNVIDSTGNNFNSPQDAMSAIGASLFPNASAGEIKCFFTGLSSEVNFFTQAKLFKNPSNANDPDFEIVRGILERCALPHTDNIVVGLLVKLNQLIDQDLLELKLKEMKEAMLEYLDVCEDPNANYIDNLKRFLDDQSARDQAKGESDAAAQKLLDLLSMLDENKIKNLGPQLYCKHGYRGPVVFDNQYTEITLDSQDKLVTSFLKDTNEKFNNDIGKFKPTILNQSFDNPLAKLGLNLTDSGGNILNTNFYKLLKGGVPKSSNEEDEEKSTVIEDLLTKVITKKLILDSSSGFKEIQSTIYSDLKFYLLKFGLNNEIFYYIFQNKGDAINDYKMWDLPTIDFEEKSVSTIMIDTAPAKAGAAQKIILEHKIVADYADVEKAVFDLLFHEPFAPDSKNIGESSSLYSTLIEGVNNSSKYSVRNILAKLYGTLLRKPSDVTSPIKKEALDIGYLFTAFDPSGPGTSDLVRSIFQNVFSGVVSRVVDGLVAFDDEVFSKIPFKDNEAKTIFSEGAGSKKFYTDGGIISIPEIFEDFKIMRSNVQCYIEKGSSPDAFQIAKLSSLYQALFNTVIVQQMLNFYFSLVMDVEQAQAFLLDDSETELVIVAHIQNAFNNSLVKTNNLSLNYERDLQKIYKYQQILDGKNPGTGTEEPSINEIITYYVNRYYGTILKKIQKRMKLGLSWDKSESFTSYAIADMMKPKTSFPIYSQNTFKSYYKYRSTQDGTYNYSDIPVYIIDSDKDGKLHNGFIIQNYVDIRQTFASVTWWQTADGDIESTEVTSPPPNYFLRTWTAPGSVSNMLNQPPPPPPSPQESNQQQKTPNWETVPNDIYQDYKDNYLRTQGKISFKDFEKYYYKPWKDTSDFTYDEKLGGITSYTHTTTEEASKIIEDNDIETFFEKASVGQRLCLVLDTSDPIAKDLLNIMSSDVFRNNTSPSLSTEEFFEQVRILFNEKVFVFWEKSDNRLKIVIPLFSLEKDCLASSTDYTSMINQIYNYHNSTLTSAYGVGKTPLLKSDDPKQQLAKLRQGVLSQVLFNDIISLTMKEALFSAYGKKLTTIFDPTIKEILSQIAVANSTMNKDWKTDSDATAESPFSTADAIDDGFDYTPLIAATLPIVIQGLATFADPTWRTPWLFPGPQTPLGFLAKILKPF